MTCILCKHWRVTEAYAYGEEDPPVVDEFEMRCDKRHWRLYPYSDGVPEIRAYLMSAENCQDFDRIPEGR